MLLVYVGGLDINQEGYLKQLSDMCRAVYRLWVYGGYSGDLSPESALDLLSGNENAVLIDIRNEASDVSFLA